MLTERRIRAVELSALRQEELIPLVEQLDSLDLRGFEYKAFHAPSLMEPEFEAVAIGVLEQVALREWPIIVHPDAMHRPSEWVADLAEIFGSLPRALLCFDIGHARQVDPTMSESSCDFAALQRQAETAACE